MITVKVMNHTALLQHEQRNANSLN